MLGEQMWHVYIPQGRNWYTKDREYFSAKEMYDEISSNKEKLITYMRTLKEISALVADGYVLVATSDRIKGQYVKDCIARGMKIAFMRCKDLDEIKRIWG